MRILMVGYGRMGKLVESLAGEYGCEIAGIVDPLVGKDGVESERRKGVDVAIDFSSPDAVMTNVPALARRHINVVVGTTGWGPHEPDLRQVIDDAGIGIVAAPNFSTGVVLFDAIVAQAAKLFAVAERLRRLSPRSAPSAARRTRRRARRCCSKARWSGRALRVRSTSRRRAPAIFPARTPSGSTDRPKR